MSPYSPVRNLNARMPMGGGAVGRFVGILRYTLKRAISIFYEDRNVDVCR